MIRTVLTSLSVLAAVCTCILTLCPDDQMKKYVRFCCALCVLSVLIPRSGVGIPELPELPGRAEITDMTDRVAMLTVNETLSRIKAATEEMIEQKHNVVPGDVSVTLIAEDGDGGVRIVRASVTLYGLGYSFKTTGIKKDVAELLGVPCEVTVDEG